MFEVFYIMFVTFCVDKDNVCCLSFIEKFSIFQTRLENDMNEFANIFTAYCEQEHSDHVMDMSFFKASVSNYFHNVGSAIIGIITYRIT